MVSGGTPHSFAITCASLPKASREASATTLPIM